MRYIISPQPRLQSNPSLFKASLQFFSERCQGWFLTFDFLVHLKVFSQNIYQYLSVQTTSYLCNYYLTQRHTPMRLLKYIQHPWKRVPLLLNVKVRSELFSRGLFIWDWNKSITKLILVSSILLRTKKLKIILAKKKWCRKFRLWKQLFCKKKNIFFAN